MLVLPTTIMQIAGGQKTFNSLFEMLANWWARLTNAPPPAFNSLFEMLSSLKLLNHSVTLDFQFSI